MSDGSSPAAPGDLETSRAYTAAYPDLVRFLQRICRDAALAEDLAQEAGMRLFSASAREAIANPRAFLFHVGANLARDLLRHQQVAQAHALQETDAAADPGADHIAGVRQEIAQVARTIETLPPRAREVLILARVEGFSNKEISARLGLAPKTVENHLTRALALLATRLRGSRDQ
ncbi:MAG TPA: sigma-70 family RNA polymerase sigma factor [Rudaea sp.]